jgi:hypothetical protein
MEVVFLKGYDLLLRAELTEFEKGQITSLYS